MDWFAAGGQATGYAGIEHAQMVVVNVRHDSDRAAAEQMAADVNRIRKDEERFADILGRRGIRTPVTVAVANVTDREDRGTRKVLARVRRTFGSVSS
jgi:NAD(P)-dependent dehydrogenase (short-subunit alcohol dehydrogenase family)